MDHYDAKYFDWQRPIGEFGGWANAAKFRDHISPSDTVLDFGCGGGFLLRELDCAKRIGIEINPTARATAEANGVKVYASTADVPDGIADKIISNHALEHTRHPLQELLALRQKLKPGGKAIFVVPCDSIALAYTPGDVNHHLYTWNPMCLGNLFTEAGFTVIESKPFIHRWPPHSYRRIAHFWGRTVFHLVCRIYARIDRTSSQVRLIAAVS